MKKQSKKHQSQRDKFFSFWFEDPIYFRDYVIYYGPWDKTARDMKKRFNLDVDEKAYKDGCTMFVKGNEGRKFCIIWLSRSDMNILSHECYHAVSDSLGTIGLPKTDDTQEAYAYYTGWLVTKIYDAVSKRLLKE